VSPQGLNQLPATLSTVTLSPTRPLTGRLGGLDPWAWLVFTLMVNGY